MGFHYSILKTSLFICFLISFLVVSCQNQASNNKSEDCIDFNPSKLEVKKEEGSWKIAEGDTWLLDFGEEKEQAEKALTIIKHYGLDQQCFVGRPEPSFRYFLSDGEAPKGQSAEVDEDCIAFDPEKIEVKEVEGSWKIVQGKRWMYDFGAQEEKARKAFDLIQKYGFTKSCFVGRPDPPFAYLKQ